MPQGIAGTRFGTNSTSCTSKFQSLAFRNFRSLVHSRGRATGYLPVLAPPLGRPGRDTVGSEVQKCSFALRSLYVANKLRETRAFIPLSNLSTLPPT